MKMIIDKLNVEQMIKLNEYIASDANHYYRHIECGSGKTQKCYIGDINIARQSEGRPRSQIYEKITINLCNNGMDYDSLKTLYDIVKE